jgi:DNA-binding Lrp family transcriptional regulator
LDSLDVQIFREVVQDRGTYPLQSDVRQSIEKVAARLSMDGATVRHRIEKLRESGFLRGWYVFPNPRLFDLGVAHVRGDVSAQSTMKDDAIRKISLVQGVWMLVNYFGSSMRVVLYFEDEAALKRQVELIARISSMENILTREIHFPPCAAKLAEGDLEVLRSLLSDPTKSYDAMSEETGMSNKTVKRRLERMLRGMALFKIPSLDPGSLRGAVLGELLVIYESPEAMRREKGEIESHLEGQLLSAQLGDPDHMLFLLAMPNVSQVKVILSWVKQQPGVKSAFLDLVEDRIEQYEAFSQQLKRKLVQVRVAGVGRLAPPPQRRKPPR